jgi:hypothetical protein
MDNLDLYRVILADLRTIAKGGVTQAEAFANLREYVPALFPPAPTGEEIRLVTDSPEWKAFDTQARRVFAEAYFSAPREIESKMWDVASFGIQVWEADKKASKDFTADQSKVRKASQDYVRVAFRQNVTKLIPAAIDAPEKVAEEKLPDPTGTLALVTQALQILSEKKPDGALALLNGLDSLVKYARPYVAEGKPIPAKG